MTVTKTTKATVASVLLATAAASIASPLSLFTTTSGSLSAPMTSHSMWTTMSSHFSLNTATDQKAVAKQIAWLQAHQASLKQTLKQAAPYISYVYNQTQAHGMPAELALLPIVESDYNPHATSKVGASGIWQLMPATASSLGLKSTATYDGRRDIVASTGAALHFLDNLGHQFHQNWNLALAAYNWGAGNMEKVVVSQHQTNFWSLQKLPAETQNYVPKLLALAAIIKDPARYHIQLPQVG